LWSSWLRAPVAVDGGDRGIWRLWKKAAESDDLVGAAGVLEAKLER
jgi:hypothetical protein